MLPARQATVGSYAFLHLPHAGQNYSHPISHWLDAFPAQQLFIIQVCTYRLYAPLQQRQAARGLVRQPLIEDAECAFMKEHLRGLMLLALSLLLL